MSHAVRLVDGAGLAFITTILRLRGGTRRGGAYSNGFARDAGGKREVQRAAHDEIQVRSCLEGLDVFWFYAYVASHHLWLIVMQERSRLVPHSTTFLYYRIFAFAYNYFISPFHIMIHHIVRHSLFDKETERFRPKEIQTRSVNTRASGLNFHRVAPSGASVALFNSSRSGVVGVDATDEERAAQTEADRRQRENNEPPKTYIGLLLSRYFVHKQKEMQGDWLVVYSWLRAR